MPPPFQTIYFVSILILYNFILQEVSFLQVSAQNSVWISLMSHTCHTVRPTHSPCWEAAGILCSSKVVFIMHFGFAVKQLYMICCIVPNLATDELVVCKLHSVSRLRWCKESHVDIRFYSYIIDASHQMVRNFVLRSPAVFPSKGLIKGTEARVLL